jgi:hypothetical protein
VSPARGGVGESRGLRLRIALSLIAVVPLGFATKVYSGPGEEWTRGRLGGVLYEVFWCLVLQIVFPRARPAAIAVAVLAGTCALEFLQLWHASFLEALRGSFLGRAVLGHTFAWPDFPYYFVGSALGWCWLRRLVPRPGPSNP